MNNNVLKKNSKIISFRKDCILISKKDFYGYHVLEIKYNKLQKFIKEFK